MGNFHTIHTVTLAGSTPLTISQLVSGSHRRTVTKTGPQTGGPYVEVQFNQQVEDRVDFVTEAIGQIIDNLVLVGANCIESGETYTSIDLFGRALDACGSDQTLAGSNHLRVRGSIGRLFVTQISAAANQSAQATLSGVLLSADGETDAVLTVNNVALPAGGLVNEAFKTHGVRLANILFDPDKITQVTLDTGINFVPVLGVKRRPMAVTIEKTFPTFSVDTEETDIEADIGEGTLATHANTLWELAKRDPSDGELVDPLSTVHIPITVAGHCHVEEPISGSGSSKATSRIVCNCTGVAGTPPITASVGAALTL